MSGARARKAEERNPWRLRMLMGLWLLCGLLLGARAVDLHVFQSEFLSRQGDLRNLRTEPLPAHRGVITDRDGRPLAVSTPVTTLWANPRELDEARDQWHRLEGNPVLDRATLARRAERGQGRELIYLARHLAPDEAQAVLDQNIGGIYSMEEYRRFYPAGEVAAHLLGFTNIDERGQEGIELALDDRLAGHPGRKRVVRDLRNRVIQDIELLQEARPGEDVSLSVDLRLQYLAYRELLAAVEQHDAAGGSVTLLDAWTGEVLALANQPGFNPNNRSGISASTLRNRAVIDMFEPGSTVKPITIAAALETGLVTPETSVNTAPGTVRVGRNTIRDLRDYGELDVAGVIRKSSNVGTVKVAMQMDEQVLPGYLERFGFGSSSGMGFPGESSGLLPIRASWSRAEQATLAYGYGVSVTGAQLARAYAALANGGRRLPLSLEPVSEVPHGEQVVEPAIADTIVEMMESVVSEEGTARRAEVPGYRVAGKTGTVHKLTASGYARDRYMAIFAGMAPAENPRYVAVVTVDDPSGDEFYGGQVAAPVFSRLMAGVLRTLNVEPSDEHGTWVGRGEEEDRT